MKISMRKLKIIIENYLREADDESPSAEDEEVSPDDLPVEDEESDAEESDAEDSDSEPEPEPSEPDESQKEEEEALERKVRDIVSDVARLAQKSTTAAVAKIKNALEYEKDEFEIDISAIPQLVDLFGKELIKKVDVDNLKENPGNRIARSQEVMKIRGDKPGGFG